MNSLSQNLAAVDSSLDKFTEHTAVTGIVLHNREGDNKFVFECAVDYACGNVLEYLDEHTCNYQDIQYAVAEHVIRHPKTGYLVNLADVVSQLYPEMYDSAKDIMKQLTPYQSTLNSLNVVDCWRADNNIDTAVMLVRYRT